MRGRKDGHRSGMIVAAGLLAASTAVGSSDPPRPAGDGGSVDPGLRESVEMLDSADWTARETAEVELRAARSFTLDDFETALESLELSAEQRLRLLEVARARFQETPRAAMGIRADRRTESGTGVPVIPIEESGFHAHKVLEPGDRIIEADGIPIRDFDDLRAAILRHDMGEIMQAVVLREGRRVEVRIRLGDYGALPRAAPLEPQIMGRAWSIRARDYDLVSALRGGVVDTGLTEAEWERLGRGVGSGRGSGEDPRRSRRRGARDNESAPPGLRVGGAGKPFDPARTRPRPQIRDANRAGLEAQLVVLRDREQQIENLRARLENVNLTPGQKEAVLRQIALLERNVRVIRQRIEEQRRLVREP